MHVRDLVDLAALLVARVATGGSPVLVASDPGFASYWTHSRIRLDRWAQRLKAYAGGERENKAAAADAWQLVRPVLEEVLVADVLTRIWAAIVNGEDAIAGGSEYMPIARNVMVGHQDARHRVLRLLGAARSVPEADLLAVNRVRRRSECWTDLLLGLLPSRFATTDFAIDAARVRSASAERQADGGDRPLGQSWQSLRQSLRGAFQRDLAPQSPHPELHGSIAASILVCLDPLCFADRGLGQSTWMERIHLITSDAQALLESALWSVADVAGPAAAGGRHYHGPAGRRGPHR